MKEDAEQGHASARGALSRPGAQARGIPRNAYMKLYYLPGACPLATQIVLEWTATPYELQAVSRSEIKEPAYLALNPLGSVPVLVDGQLAGVVSIGDVVKHHIATLEHETKAMHDYIVNPY